MNKLFSTHGLCLMAVLLLVLGHTSQAADATALLAGSARVKLTPPTEMKASLGGYGARMSKPAMGEHDGVWGKSLVLEQGPRRFAVVTADVLAFPPGFKAAVVGRLNTNRWLANQIMLLPSHSHTSIDMMAIHPRNSFEIPQVGIFQKELFEFTADRIAKVIQEADSGLAPIIVGSVTVPLPGRNRNRREGNGPHDTALTVTRIDAKPGQPIAALVNWTAHPTFMDEEDMMFSGDWPGHLQRTVEALVGQGVTVMFYNGAEGDQSPVPPDCASNWERAERYGREIGIRTWRAWEKIHPKETRTLNYHTEAISLPERRSHPDFMKTGGAEYGLNPGTMQVFLEAMVPAQTHCTLVRLGDLVIIGVPGEMSAALGLEAKSAVAEITGASSVTIGGLADEWVSYILPAGEYKKGGYEASMSFYGESLGKTLMDGITRGARNLK